MINSSLYVYNHSYYIYVVDITTKIDQSPIKRGGFFPQFLSFWTFYKPILLFSIQSFTSFLKSIQNTFQNHEKLKNCGNFSPLSNMDHPVVGINGYYMYVVQILIDNGISNREKRRSTT